MTVKKVVTYTHPTNKELSPIVETTEYPDDPHIIDNDHMMFNNGTREVLICFVKNDIDVPYDPLTSLLYGKMIECTACGKKIQYRKVA